MAFEKLLKKVDAFIDDDDSVGIVTFDALTNIMDKSEEALRKELKTLRDELPPTPFPHGSTLLNHVEEWMNVSFTNWREMIASPNAFEVDSVNEKIKEVVKESGNVITFEEAKQRVQVITLNYQLNDTAEQWLTEIQRIRVLNCIAE